MLPSRTVLKNFPLERFGGNGNRDYTPIGLQTEQPGSIWNPDENEEEYRSGFPANCQDISSFQPNQEVVSPPPCLPLYHLTTSPPCLPIHTTIKRADLEARIQHARVTIVLLADQQQAYSSH